MLTDAGPLAAFIDRRDQYHPPAQRSLAMLGDEPLLTTCPCFAEAMHLLGDSGGYRHQSLLLSLFHQGLLQIHYLTPSRKSALSPCWSSTGIAPWTTPTPP